MIHEYSEVPTGATIREFEAILSSLQGKCAEGEEHIGNMLVKARQILQDDGIRITLLDLAKELNISTSPFKSDGLACAEQLAVLVALMQQSPSYR